MMIFDFIDKELNEQIDKRNLLLKCMENISETIENIQNIDNTDILFDILENLKDSFEAINSNIKNYNEIKDNNAIYENYKDEISKNDDKVYNFLNYYISNCNFTFLSTNAIHETPKDKTNVDVDDEVEVKTETETKADVEPEADVKTEAETKADIEPEAETQSTEPVESISDNKILLISEKQNLVYLPYLLSDIEKLLNDNKDKYTDLQDVIEKNYIVPLNRFKNPIFSRFKEAFSLMRNKEKAPLPQCLDLALELSFNSLLNPAIIAACKNLDELDIYLDYLESNELDKFTIFEIKYEVMPIKKSSKKGF